MLIDASRHQRRQCPRGALNALRGRVLPIAKQPRHDARQCRQVIDGIAAMVHRIAKDGADFARKRVGDHPLALDQSGIAVARLLARPAAIDEDDITAALLQMERDAHSDHSRAEDNHIGPHRHLGRSPPSIVQSL
jgi:hypothetical protein